MKSAMESTFKNAVRAISAFGVATPKFFSRHTASSSASMESRPSPSGAKSGVLSPISSGAILSMRLSTIMVLIRELSSGSVICGNSLLGKEREL